MHHHHDQQHGRRTLHRDASSHDGSATFTITRVGECPARVSPSVRVRYVGPRIEMSCPARFSSMRNSTEDVRFWVSVSLLIECAPRDLVTLAVWTN